MFDNNTNYMTYSYYHTVIKWKTPPNASTANAYENKTEKKEEAEKPKAIYRCKVCGFEYKGSVPFEELPNDWKYPICGEPKSNFEKVE